jgi:hypothetical protein
VLLAAGSTSKTRFGSVHAFAGVADAPEQLETSASPGRIRPPRSKLRRRLPAISTARRSPGVIDYIDEVWPARPWQRGAYMAVPGPGVLTAFGPALREPVVLYDRCERSAISQRRRGLCRGS